MKLCFLYGISSFLYLKPFSKNVVDMISESGLFAKIILLILAFFSLVSWAIIINKLRVFRKVSSDTERFFALFRKRKKISDVYLACLKLRRTPLSKMLEAGYREWEGNPEKRGTDYVESLAQTPAEKTEKYDMIKMTLDRVGSEETEKLGNYLIFLATTGNVSPFLGLLGTVWGVMDSFASIGIKGSATLAVVAPGIAEALIATIAGLAVAIPGVIGYNYFGNKLKALSVEADNFSLELLSALKKEEKS